MGSRKDKDTGVLTWRRLNQVLKNCTAAECLAFLETEMKGKRRANFVRRIHSRYNFLRAAAERYSLTKGVLIDDGYIRLGKEQK